MQSTSFGLIGHPLGHSLSPLIHESLMASAGISGTYRLFDIRPEDLVWRLTQIQSELSGFNVTIPHKETIIPFLDTLDPSASDFGAVNTVFQRKGYNTDRIGFRRAGIDLSGRNVLVTGAGGVSRMLTFEAVRAGAKVTIVSRTFAKTQQLAEFMGATAMTIDELATVQSRGISFDVLLNGSPVGMWPQTDAMPVPKTLIRSCGCLFDTIYNPLATRMLLLARSDRPDQPTHSAPVTYNGLGMLFEQALEAERIWHPQAFFPEADQLTIRQSLSGKLLRDFPMHFVLTGFMGSGKSTTGHRLAQRLNLTFMDLDDELVRIAGKKIPDIFADEGEAWFRQLEKQTLKQILTRPESFVLAVGGGALVEPESVALVRERPTQIVFLDLPLTDLAQRLADGEGRPMLSGDVQERTKTLFEHRLPRYLASADLTVDGRGEPEAVAATIAWKLGYDTGGK